VCVRKILATLSQNFFHYRDCSCKEPTFAYRDRLSASDMLQVRKVIEHVYEKVMGQGSDGGSQTAGTPATGSGQMDKSETTYKDDEMSSIADEKVELLCNDQVCCTLPTGNAYTCMFPFGNNDCMND
jgi:hypothetical protein